jgi:hypothetical protein
MASLIIAVLFLLFFKPNVCHTYSKLGSMFEHIFPVGKKIRMEAAEKSSWDVAYNFFEI